MPCELLYYPLVGISFSNKFSTVRSAVLASSIIKALHLIFLPVVCFAIYLHYACSVNKKIAVEINQL